MMLRCLGLAISLALVPFLATLAQERRPCPAPDGAIHLACNADVPPEPAPDRKLPLYPDILRQAGVGGDVRVRYVLDTAGRVVPGTLVIVQSKHDLFTSMVKAAVPGWTFTPALRSGKRIAVLYEEFFVFRDQPGGPPDNDMVGVQDTTMDGIPRTTIGPAGLDSLASAAFSLEDLKEAQLSVLLVLAGNVRLSQTGRVPTLCVSFRREGVEAPADVATLRRLEAPGRRVVAKRDCPETYASMIVQRDSLGRLVDGRPPGSVDPYYLSVRRVEPWSRVLVLVDAAVGQGLGGRNYRCGTRRANSVWSATCTLISGWMS